MIHEINPVVDVWCRANSRESANLDDKFSLLDISVVFILKLQGDTGQQICNADVLLLLRLRLGRRVFGSV